MGDTDCIAFLRAILPHLHLRWEGFRRVRRQVCRRLEARRRALGLASLDDYRAWLDQHPDELRVLDGMCRVTISRFWRDRAVFDALGARLLPALAERARQRGAGELRVWSAGCGSGEEPYSLAILWRLEVGPRFHGLALRVVATDVDAHLLERAREGVYPASSLREIPAALRARAFEPVEDGGRLRPDFREGIELRCEDLRDGAPAGHGLFDLVLCRNLAFTYFDESLQRRALADIAEALLPGGVLLLGSHERLLSDAPGFAPEPAVRGAWRRLP
jgi:chemotaxis protein methyltransferase CheR